MARYYVLDADDQPVQVEDVLTWAKWFEDGNSNRRLVMSTYIGGVHISTVFLGINHHFRQLGDPVLWETMIFGGSNDGFQRRYSSKAEALAGHAEALKLATTPAGRSEQP